jgi:hypothetical protein
MLKGSLGFLILATLLNPLISRAAQPAQATMNLVATVPSTCSLLLQGSIDPLVLGEAIRSQSLERFQIPVLVECNTPNAKLKALPVGLTSPQAPGFTVYYHVNTSIGLGSGVGWVNTSWQQPAVLATFSEPVKQEVMVLLEGFREDKGKALPAGNYSGYVHLTIGAE